MKVHISNAEVSGGASMLVGVDKRERNLELAFVAVFSIMVFLLFFFLLGANGLILGNDPAVHLQRAQMFLNVGRIPISDIAWYPPLYQIVLATFMAFTGATNTDQILVLMKALTTLIDWLLIFSVYLIAARFFGKKTGVLAAALLLLCFPLYEINSWGGYTAILSMAFMVLAFLYLASPLKSVWSSLVTFILAFSVVMSHQLATFLSVFILPPFIIVVLIRSKGPYRKALFAALLGGGIAFLVYYLRPMLPYLGDLISIVFFQLKTMLYQVPSVSFDNFMMYFGFALFFAFAGLIIAFVQLRRKKSLSFYLLLVMAFLVPLFLSQSYLVGVYLPYQWFIYYLMPPLAVLAAVAFSLLIEAVLASYFNNRKGWKKLLFKAVSVAIVVALAVVMVLRFDTVFFKVGEDATFYSISDVNAYNAGSWIKTNYPNPSTQIVVSSKPGHWFSVYSGKKVIAETDPIIEWNVNAECVLDLSYEMAHPLTLVRVFEAKGNISDGTYASMNMVWVNATYSSEDIAYITYHDQNDIVRTYQLSTLNRTVAFDEINWPKKIAVTYTGEDIVFTESILMQNDTYPVTVTWQVSALKSNLTHVALFFGYYFDPRLSFKQAYVAGALDWQTPWDNASRVEADNWAVTNFARQNLTEDNHIDVYDESNQIGFALKFLDLPESGNLGSLSDRKLDAVRFQYQFAKVDANQTVSFSYQTLTFSMSSVPQLQNPREMNSLFDIKPSEPFEVSCRNFASIIRDNNVGFIVYDIQPYENRFDTGLLSSKWVNLVYANDKYVVLQIKSDHPIASVVEK